MEQVKAFTLHEEHTTWLNKLNFYTDDLAVLQKQLQEVVSKNNAPDFLAHAEHFQNQFIMRKEQMDELRHAINEHESFVESKVDTNPAAAHVSLHDHSNERSSVDSFEEAFNALRREFIGFLSKYM